jgi:O-antigen/teichoic acid export membrane protein
MVDFLRNIFNTNQQYLKSGSLLVYANIITSMTSIGLVYIFANFIPQETYGTYKYILSIASLLSIFTLQGMNVAITQAVSRGYETAIQKGLRTKILFGFIGTAIGLCISGYYYLQGNDTLGTTFLIVAIATPFFGTFDIYRSYLNGKREFKTIAKETTSYNALFFILFATTLLTTSNIITIVFCYFLFSSLLQLLFYLKVTKQFPPQQKNDEEDISQYGKSLSLMKALSTASGSISSLALWHILGPASLPIYALALAPIEQIRPMLQLAENLLMPKISQENWQVLSLRWFFKKTAIFFFVISIGIVIYIAAAPFLYQLLFPQYLESVLLSQILSVGLIFTALNILLQTIMKSKKQVKNLHVTNTVTIMVEFLSIPMIFFFGILGLIINVLISKSLLAVVSLFLLFSKEKST